MKGLDIWLTTDPNESAGVAEENFNIHIFDAPYMAEHYPNDTTDDVFAEVEKVVTNYMECYQNEDWAYMQKYYDKEKYGTYYYEHPLTITALARYKQHLQRIRSILIAMKPELVLRSHE